jgi:hypothetical protein
VATAVVSRPAPSGSSTAPTIRRSRQSAGSSAGPGTPRTPPVGGPVGLPEQHRVRGRRVAAGRPGAQGRDAAGVLVDRGAAALVHHDQPGPAPARELAGGVDPQQLVAPHRRTGQHRRVEQGEPGRPRTGPVTGR